MTTLTRKDKETIRRSVARLLAKAGDADRFSTGLRKLLRSLGRPEAAAGAARAIPGLGESFGVPVPVLGLIAAELSPWGKEHPEGAFSLVARLWEGKGRDERVLAAKLLERLGKLHPERTLEVASPLVGDLRNWEECDQLASFGLRSVVTARPDLVLPRCADWGRSEARWTRRFAVVVLTSLPKPRPSTSTATRRARTATLRGSCGSPQRDSPRRRERDWTLDWEGADDARQERRKGPCLRVWALSRSLPQIRVRGAQPPSGLPLGGDAVLRRRLPLRHEARPAHLRRVRGVSLSAAPRRPEGRGRARRLHDPEALENPARIREVGLDATLAEETKRRVPAEELLAGGNDGRSMTSYGTACALLAPAEVRAAQGRTTSEEGPKKWHRAMKEALR
ncbi:MAG: DNA alkylation repair protein, partial [Candidatus Bipolaricaulota bacterium]|nr:DNA alkylation repair protein [Candidatus Bipolaricaulota bacterium]